MALTTTNLSITTPLQLVNSLLGVGITANNITFTGANVAGGSFGNGLGDGLGIDSGVILSTGDIAGAIGPNNADDTSTNNGTSGDPALTTIVSNTTNDAAILQFDFIPTAPVLRFKYVFASEEYKEFVGNVFNDVFAFFLNGTNIALIPGTSTPVSINNVNQDINTNRFVNNTSPNPPNPLFGTQFDGFTTVLEARARVTPGVTNTIRLAIADAFDSIFDSAVFIQAGSFNSTAPDLTVTKTGTPNPVKVGDPITYTIVASNIGNDNETGIVVRDTLPTSLTNITTTVSGGFTANISGNVVNFTGGNLLAGGSSILTITGNTTENVSPIANTVFIDPDDISFELDETNNEATVSTTVTLLPDLTVTKTDSPDPVVLGNPLTYTINVSNIGKADTTGVVVQDTLPSGLTNISTTVNNGFTAAVNGNVVTFSGGSLVQGATTTLKIQATPTLIPSSSALTNTVIVDPNGLIGEFDETNNTATATTTVIAPDLTITKTDTPDPVSVGQTLSYVIRASNSGNANATGVVVQDTLPTGLTNITFVPANGFTGSSSGSVVTFSGGTLATGASADFVITGTLGSGSNSIVNNVVIDPNNTVLESNEANNNAQATTTVITGSPSPSPSSSPNPSPSPNPNQSPSPTPIVNQFPSFSNTFITGTDASELFNLTDVGDAIAAGGGDDTVFGFNGNDLEFGNSGNDQLNGNQGNDTLYGGQDNDIVSGGKDSDFVYGDRGDDIVNGNNGNDIVYGGKGNDTVYGGQNEDSVSGDLGNDYVSGDLGDDVLTGVSASSLAPGLGEIDTLIGGAGRDVFVLGDSIIPYYDDTNTSLPGTSDYAEIRDFTPGTDRIQLKTGPSYFLGSSPVGLPSGAGLFINQGGGSELIAILIGIAPGSLDLGSSNFTYVGVV